MILLRERRVTRWRFSATDLPPTSLDKGSSDKILYWSGDFVFLQNNLKFLPDSTLPKTALKRYLPKYYLPKNSTEKGTFKRMKFITMSVKNKKKSDWIYYDV